MLHGKATFTPGLYVNKQASQPLPNTYIARTYSMDAAALYVIPICIMARLFFFAVAIDPAGSQYIDYANAFTHAHLRLASISLAKLSSKL